MSRIILDRYEDGQERIVVGWDHPCGGAFWQEFNREVNPDTGKPYWETDEDWEEVTRNGGMWPGIPLDQLIDSMPDDLKPLMTGTVMDLLYYHAEDPESGRMAPIDLTKEKNA